MYGSLEDGAKVYFSNPFFSVKGSFSNSAIKLISFMLPSTAFIAHLLLDDFSV